MMTAWSLPHPAATAGVDGLARVALGSLGNVAGDLIESAQAGRAGA
jgi:hypothetical protein